MKRNKWNQVTPEQIEAQLKDLKWKLENNKPVIISTYFGGDRVSQKVEAVFMNIKEPGDVFDLIIGAATSFISHADPEYKENLVELFHIILQKMTEAPDAIKGKDRIVH